MQQWVRRSKRSILTTGQALLSRGSSGPLLAVQGAVVDDENGRSARAFSETGGIGRGEAATDVVVAIDVALTDTHDAPRTGTAGDARVSRTGDRSGKGRQTGARNSSSSRQTGTEPGCSASFPLSLHWIGSSEECNDWFVSGQDVVEQGRARTLPRRGTRIFLRAQGLTSTKAVQAPLSWPWAPQRKHTTTPGTTGQRDVKCACDVCAAVPQRPQV